MAGRRLRVAAMSVRTSQPQAWQARSAARQSAMPDAARTSIVARITFKGKAAPLMGPQDRPGTVAGPAMGLIDRKVSIKGGSAGTLHPQRARDDQRHGFVVIMSPGTSSSTFAK
jgi:hypothetical protein